MGLIVGLSGVDGSGKTTIAKRVVDRLQSQGLKVTYYHELDFILLKPIFRLAARLVSKRAENTKARVLLSVEQGKPLYSGMYYFLVWLDNFISYLYLKVKRGIIVHDRWPYDIPAIFGYRHYKNRFIEKLLLSFPRPDILILLTVPPEVAHLRKRDDPLDWHQSVEFYRVIGLRISEIARKLKYDGFIDSNRPVDEVVDDVSALITNSKKMEVQHIHGVTGSSRLSKWLKARWQLILFLAILIGLFGYLYRDLFHWKMLGLMDLAPWYSTSSEAYKAFSSSWTHMGLGNYDSLGPGDFMIMSSLTALFWGNAAMAQRIFWLSIMPLSAITMRILLGRFTSSNIAKLIIPMVYAVNGITIVWFQIGAYAFYPAFVLFPLLMLYLVKILEEKERRLLSMLIFTLIYGLMANWLLYSLLYFLPFVVIFFLIETIYRRDWKYTAKTSFLFVGSFGIMFLLVAPIGFDQLLNIVGFYVKSSKTFGYYTPLPIENWLEAIRVAFSWPETVSMITNLTYLLGFSAFGTLFIRHRTRLKYYLSLLLITTLLILFARLVSMGLIINWFAYFPVLITFQHPGKLAMMASWSFFLMMAILVSEVEERVALRHKATS